MSDKLEICFFLQYRYLNYQVFQNLVLYVAQKKGQKSPLDKPKRMTEKRQRDREREKERKKERYREWGRDKRERERGERDRDVKGMERWKARRVNPTLCLMLSPNYLRPIPTKKDGDAHVFLFERKILMKSQKPGNKAQRKVDYTNHYAITMRRNYQWKLSANISITQKMWDL